MNHKQISDLTHRPNTVFELREDYNYSSEIWGDCIIKKGSKFRYLHPALELWCFEFQEKQGILGWRINFGRSRLLKLKVKEISEFKENEE